MVTWQEAPQLRAWRSATTAAATRRGRDDRSNVVSEAQLRGDGHNRSLAADLVRGNIRVESPASSPAPAVRCYGSASGSNASVERYYGSRAASLSAQSRSERVRRRGHSVGSAVPRQRHAPRGHKVGNRSPPARIRLSARQRTSRNIRKGRSATRPRRPAEADNSSQDLTTAMRRGDHAGSSGGHHQRTCSIDLDDASSADDRHAVALSTPRACRSSSAHGRVNGHSASRQQASTLRSAVPKKVSARAPTPSFSRDVA